MPLSNSGDLSALINRETRAPDFSIHRRGAENSALAAALRATTPEVLRAGSHDVVVIGAGAAGGLAAMLLAEAGLRVLVLEAGSGRSAVDLPLTRAMPRPDSHRQPIQSRCYAWHLAPKA